MNRPDIERSPAPPAVIPQGLHQLAEQAFKRAAGARLIPGNGVRILKDAAENFPAWLDAIHAAERTVYFESYIIGDDAVGREFVQALAERARAGVRVRVLYDWLGTRASRSLFAPLIEAGGAVRVFNPPRFDSPVGWLTRDHRKSIAVDGRVGFVSGLCASARWLGNPARRIDAWRDTGVEIRGPAVAEVERAFGDVWAACGGSAIDEAEYTAPDSIAPAGDVAVRVIATVPDSGGLFRIDQLIAAAADGRLWLTDAYFVGLTPYVQALCSAARDDVDVRLLVPGASDLPVLSRISRTGYRVLLENGVRVFEWNGSMLHAKSAVADDRWARVGSTNLNIASWLANYELDVAIEDERLVASLAEMYEKDLANATEIVLGRRYRVRALPADAGPNARRTFSGSAGRAAAGAVSVGAVVGAALTSRRILGPAEASLLGMAAATLIVLAAIAVMWPEVLAYPIALIAAWAGIVMLLRARRLWRERRRRRAASS
ncbi:MAG TPA: phospholipase D-like domain-containing protein [Burkholderiales bacterium]|nr:phospholipase D-like domain-containing protein [Burkholderiales bacterium]